MKHGTEPWGTLLGPWQPPGTSLEGSPPLVPQRPPVAASRYTTKDFQHQLFVTCQTHTPSTPALPARADGREGRLYREPGSGIMWKKL
ncbi:hypothetical protein E2C01_100641 [Portunus trituberculatus]|uniref:Uncharacterized protein n=1 Tax=Portunus trituberculatus TaxID=210409 RepID=A0A5B7KE34_PORTR|nr:hypothetical protein [Portunus trituberculatus]